MKTTFISSATLWNSPRSTLDKLQSELVKANKEVVTGRHMDVGLALGRKTGKSLSLRQERLTLDTLTDSNATTTLRLKSTSAALDQVRSVADSFKNSLIGMYVGSQDVPLVSSQAKAGLDKLISTMNENVGSQYLFGGVNSKTQPLNAYDPGPKEAVNEAFVAFFNFSQTDADVADITPDLMKQFIDGPLSDLFKDQWKDTWSNASDQNIQSLISPTERVKTSASADDKAFRQLAMAYVMTFDLGISGLSDDTRNYLLNRVVGTLGEGISSVTEVQADLGTVQQKIDQANERMSLQKSFLDERITNYEAVDPAEAKVRIDQLSTQIQTSYSLTAQLNQLSLINFL
ncbi:flagellar hook-associated family protein [Microvirga guangxiensis]|uniref:Flagellin n=1 Tax=Microvirga guangxiensis TaxID=549386 RepID=A0A1G5CST7_9HYPH|nr:flagellar hook-associated family protein [Microvirga guangxiensis]SCY05444.1 flagellar hook-associated protein 3 FlgL [Microvirga guangxiensis]